MIRNLFFSFFMTSLVACATDPSTDDMGGGDNGGDQGGGGGGGTTTGALTLTGSSVQQGQSGASPLAGATIAAYRVGSDTPVAMATSDAQGKYTLSIETAPFDGYIKASKSSYADTYVYPASPWTADASIETSQLSSTTFSLLNTFAGGDSDKGLIIATIVDANGEPVSGAKISSAPAAGSYKYSDGTGSPTGGSTTPEDGVAFYMSAPVGNVALSAFKNGMTFKSHFVTTHGGALVTTEIASQP